MSECHKCGSRACGLVVVQEKVWCAQCLEIRLATLERGVARAYENLVGPDFNLTPAHTSYCYSVMIPAADENACVCGLIDARETLRKLLEDV